MNDNTIIDMFAKRDAKYEERFNQIESKVDETNGYLKGVVDSNQKLIKLLTVAIGIISFIAVLAVGAIIVGAIGKDGFKTVRDSMPKVSYAIPATNDLDKWQNHRHNAIWIS